MDYKKLGLKCGLEIHQQLNTGKLFARTPSIIRDDAFDYKVKRYLRAISGESGEVDKAALAEKKKEKYFEYEGYADTISLVELDEEPPSDMDKDALYTVLQMCKLLKSTIVDNIRVMRKTVIDGSNTSGFQRTSLVGIGGSVGNVGIESVCIEEDSAKLVKRSSTHDVYNLSRLGIPLIEIATAPDIKTPEQAQEVALQIGMLLRSTMRVKRGLGTIRQDLNISIKDGKRIEMKGVQDVKLIPTYVELEVQRQALLVDIFKELKKRKACAEDKIFDVTSVFAKCEGKVIKSALDKKGVVFAIKLPSYAGFLGKEIQPNRRLGSEFSDYAKTQGVKGLFHSDELPKYGISEKEVLDVRKFLKVGKDDAFILIADQKEVAQRALEVVIHRANVLEIVKEVRLAKPDGTSSFMRPMPGAARMYPETDVKSITPDVKDVKLPELIEEKEKRYMSSYKLSKEYAGQLAKKGYAFDSYVKEYADFKPLFLAQVLLTYPKELKKRYSVSVSDDYEKHLKVVLGKLKEKKITEQAVLDVLGKLCKGKKVAWSSYGVMDEKELDKIILDVYTKEKGAPIGALMGKVMAKVQGRANGKEVMRKLQLMLKK